MESTILFWIVTATMGLLIGVFGKADDSGKVHQALLIGGLMATGVGIICGVVFGYSTESIVAMLWFSDESKVDTAGFSRFIALGYALIIGAIILEFKRQAISFKKRK